MSQKLFNLVASDGTVLLEAGTQAQCREADNQYRGEGGQMVTTLRAAGRVRVAAPTQPAPIQEQQVLVAKSTIVQAGELVLTQYPNSSVAKRAAQGRAITNKQIEWLASRAAALRKLEVAMA